MTKFLALLQEGRHRWRSCRCAGSSSTARSFAVKSVCWDPRGTVPWTRWSSSEQPRWSSTMEGMRFSVPSESRAPEAALPCVLPSRSTTWTTARRDYDAVVSPRRIPQFGLDIMPHPISVDDGPHLASCTIPAISPVDIMRHAGEHFFRRRTRRSDQPGPSPRIIRSPMPPRSRSQRRHATSESPMAQAARLLATPEQWKVSRDSPD